jgi:molybdenum cofactor guanylyltransferase
VSGAERPSAGARPVSDSERARAGGRPEPAPLAVVLAGGAARRMGGAKMTAPLAGRPLVAWPLGALRAVLDAVVVVVKRDTPLPALDVPVWVEPDEPRHPLAGVVHALREADGRAVVVCAGDMPVVQPSTLRRLASATGASLVVRGGDRLEPLLARYQPADLAVLERAAKEGRPATAVVAELGAEVVDAHPDSMLNVNAPDDFAAAERALGECISRR